MTRDDRHAAAAALATVALTVAAHFLDFALEVGDLALDFAAIDFQLCFTGAARAHTAHSTAARLSRQVRPLPRKAREAIFILRQLDLQRPLARACMAGEDIHNEDRTVQHQNLWSEAFL